MGWLSKSNGEFSTAIGLSAVANGRGEMMAPHVMRSMVRDGFQYTPNAQVVGKPVSAETAKTLTEMLATSLEGESSDALVDGYRVAGKTGTAEIATPTGYTGDSTNASFVGWGPVGNPRLADYVIFIQDAPVAGITGPGAVIAQNK